MKKLAYTIITYMIITLTVITQVYGFNVIFMDQVTRGFFFGGTTPDCYITPGPTLSINPYFGVSITANIVQNANTTAVINSLGGNPVSVSERCLPNGNLAELGCSIAYSGYPDNYVAALEYAPTDLITTQPMRCEMYRSQGQAVIEKPAFFHRSIPGSTYIQPGTLGPTVTITLSCPAINIAVSPSSQTRQITRIWIESAPVQGQNPTTYIQSAGACPTGSSCGIFGGPLPSGTAHVYVTESDPSTNVTTVNSVRC